MSKNITIKEGGKSRAFGPVKALMVDGGDNEFYPWYPAGQSSNILAVNENKIYQAKDYSVLCWGQVDVDVPNMIPPTYSVIGKDRDTNDVYGVYVDQETGELVRVVLPVAITVSQYPTKTDYVIGETIDYSGIKVRTIDNRGAMMGEVPFRELTFPVKKAQGGGEPWEGGGSIQHVPVQWHDPDSGATLETNFEIFVEDGG